MPTVIIKWVVSVFIEHVIVQLRERFDLQSSYCWEKIFTTEEMCGMYQTWEEEIYQILLPTV
jgi:hypothetical protein